ncbi:unnamed protein product [Peronospora belbahrii]|uniref:Uncharacterized protein n=1 Tax=Peronospora belbahrii TaxID=622444 RepID=A0ABN8CXL1_9STRA|nr:unnamed protein product [Peronospora belbahrii]
MTPIPFVDGVGLMMIEKDRSRTWPENYQYLAYESERSSSSELSVLGCLCKSSLYTSRPQSLASKETVVLNAQVMDKAVGILAMGEWTKVGVEGDTSHELGPPIQKYVMDAGTPGPSLRLVNNSMMLKNAVVCNLTCCAANNTMVEVTKVKSIELKRMVDGESYGVLEERGICLERHGNHSYVVRQADKMKIFEVFHRNNVLTIDLKCELKKDVPAQGVYRNKYTST